MPRLVNSFVLFLLVAVSAYLLICLLAYAYQRQLIYHPIKVVAQTPDQINLAYEAHLLESADKNRFVVWEIQAAVCEFVIVFFHGNAENISHNVLLYQQLHDLGATVYAFEYRGYTSSEGSPSEQGIELDLRTFAEFLRQDLGDDETIVVALGRSLGGAVAVKFSQDFKLDGLILESTFNRMSDIAARAFPFLPTGLLLRERYDSEEILSRQEIPVLMLHSRKDQVAPFDLAEQLFLSARGPKKFVELTGGHNDFHLQPGGEIERALKDFLKSLKR